MNPKESLLPHTGVVQSPIHNIQLNSGRRWRERTACIEKKNTRQRRLLNCMNPLRSIVNEQVHEPPPLHHTHHQESSRLYLIAHRTKCTCSTERDFLSVFPRSSTVHHAIVRSGEEHLKKISILNVPVPNVIN